MTDSAEDISYKTSDILSLYGLSNKGLFYYEEKGLISPQRSFGGNYRVFTLRETSRLHECRLLRSYGFSVEDSVSLVVNASPDELVASFERRLNEIHRDMIWSQMVTEQLQRDIESIKRIQCGDIPWEIMERPSMIRVSLRDMHSSYDQQGEARYQHWQKYLPIANASLLFPECESAHDEIPVNLGFIMDASVTDQLSIEIPDNAELLKPVKCLHTFIAGSNHLLNQKQRLSSLLDYINAHHLQISGCIVTRMIASCDIGNGMQRFDHLWCPIA